MRVCVATSFIGQVPHFYPKAVVRKTVLLLKEKLRDITWDYTVTYTNFASKNNMAVNKLTFFLETHSQKCISQWGKWLINNSFLTVYRKRTGFLIMVLQLLSVRGTFHGTIIRLPLFTFLCTIINMLNNSCHWGSESIILLHTHRHTHIGQ